MSQIYENAVTIDPAASLDANATDPLRLQNDLGCVELLSPPRGVLKKFVIKQTGGATDGYTARLFNRRDACSGHAVESLSPEDYVEHVDPDLHLVIPDVVAAAGGGNVLDAQYELEAGYENQDERGISHTIKSRLWLEIIPVSGESGKVFQIMYGVRPLESLS